MLTQLTIRNYAIIDHLELEFESSMTSLTGETGAGKSILLGALGLVLGDRADLDSIKKNHDHAEIVAEFDINNLSNVTAWLVEQELNADNECILRRRVSKDGRSRAYINSTPVNLQLIRELGEMLIDIHGQHEHQSMMKPAVQRQLLDDYAAHPDLIESISNLYVQHKLAAEQLHHLEVASTDRNDRLDLLRFQTQELDALALEENEYAELNEKHARMANAERLATTAQQALQNLYSDDESSIQSRLAKTLHSILDTSKLDENLKPVADLLQDALVQVEESVSQLRIYEDSLEPDPNQLASIEQRIQVVFDLARKHRVEAEELPSLHQQLVKELEDIDHADERLEELRTECASLAQLYQGAATRLSNSREKAATQLNKKITAAMQTLGMSGGKFKINVSRSTRDKYTTHGSDKIEFTVSANTGQDCKPLARVASGGELARISLAIAMITASQARIPTLIFDEVDSGVGGGIAEIVGQHLRVLGTGAGHRVGNQVICITHLPQVASQSHHHMRVFKQSQKQHTSTRVVSLNPEERIEEIARMLSGVEITQQSLNHAEEMIARAQET